ncbi:MAG: DUF1569 domain-containing protein [Planctomycetota bacterium]|jgi:hypothetical protein
MVKTSKVTDRRELQFSSMPDILEDVAYLASGDPPRTTGNWSGGQIVQHVAMLINLSIDGFPAPRLALPMRILGRLVRKRALVNSMSAGIRFPRKWAFLAPDGAITWEDAVEYMNETMSRLGTDRMTAPSPILGKLSHEQWEQLHCRHAEMHFSFMHPA